MEFCSPLSLSLCYFPFLFPPPAPVTHTLSLSELGLPLAQDVLDHLIPANNRG